MRFSRNCYVKITVQSNFKDSNILAKLVIALGQEVNGYNLGMSFRSFIK